MSIEENKLKMNIKKYDIAIATRNFEIELFWKRSLFFWGFIAAAFIGYTTIIEFDRRLAIVIASFGFVCSFAWTLVNRGSKRWQENWEILVFEIENEVTGSLFKERREKEIKSTWLAAKKFSVSKITIALSDFTVLIWLILMVPHSSIHIYEAIVSIGSIFFAVAMLIFCKSSD
jgi:hypothetical protein